MEESDEAREEKEFIIANFFFIVCEKKYVMNLYIII